MSAQQKKMMAPPSIVVPMWIAIEIERLVEAFQARLGEPIEDVRRAVEVTILKRGLEAVKAEEGRKR